MQFYLVTTKTYHLSQKSELHAQYNVVVELKTEGRHCPFRFLKYLSLCILKKFRFNILVYTKISAKLSAIGRNWLTPSAFYLFLRTMSLYFQQVVFL